MLRDINIEEVLFIDIETVPKTPEFSELNKKWKQLWEYKIHNQINNDEPAEVLYDKAGIFAEFGRIICISAGYVFLNNEELSFKVQSFYDNNENNLIHNFFNSLKSFSKEGKRRLCAHNGQEFDFPYIARRALVNNLPLPMLLDIYGPILGKYEIN